MLRRLPLRQPLIIRDMSSAATPAPPGLATLLLRIGAAGVAYALSGWLGLQLAIPPGYATAVWPASGIALAAVLLGGAPTVVGVWLGSFFVNAFLGPSGIAVGGGGHVDARPV